MCVSEPHFETAGRVWINVRGVAASDGLRIAIQRRTIPRCSVLRQAEIHEAWEFVAVGGPCAKVRRGNWQLEDFFLECGALARRTSVGTGCGIEVS